MTGNDRIKVRLWGETKIFIHQSLRSTASYFKNRVDSASKDYPGIGLDRVACLVMLAFSAEANANFFGWKISPHRWNEGDKLKDKYKKIARQLGVKANFGTRPYSTIIELKNFRDMMAHGKPDIHKFDDIKQVTHAELEKLDLLTPDWQSLLTPDFVSRAYEDIDEVWTSLLKAANLSPFDHLTQANRTIEFIGPAES